MLFNVQRVLYDNAFDPVLCKICIRVVNGAEKACRAGVRLSYSIVNTYLYLSGDFPVIDSLSILSDLYLALLQ